MCCGIGEVVFPQERNVTTTLKTIKHNIRVRFWKENFDDLMRFYEFPYEVRRFIYTTNQLERLFKEVKRRLKVMEMLPEVENADKILFLIFYELNERISKKRLPGFELVFSDTFHNHAQEVK